MEYKAKENNGKYELFVSKTAKDVDDNDVTIMESIGIYEKETLESIKQSLLDQISGVENKIKSIEEIE